MNLITIKKTNEALSAVRHGKLTTVLLYGTVAAHLIWFNIPIIVSNLLIAVSTAMMLFSAVQYALVVSGFYPRKTSDCIRRRQKVFF